jgi:hypothetical protein
MQVTNIHERTLLMNAGDAWYLIESLGAANDLLWPVGCWPRMRLDRPLTLGASGGHGPIGYTVVEYVPRVAVKFRFNRPAGYDGYHEFRILPRAGGVTLRHTLIMQTRGSASWSWLLVLRPLHDALLQDLMDRASSYSSGHPFESSWSLRVMFTRWLLGKLPGLRAPGRHASGAMKTSL